MSNGEPVASLHVDVSAKIDQAERNLQQFEQRLDRASSRSQQLATQIDSAGKRTAASAAKTDGLTTSLKAADQAMTGLEKAIASANRNAAKAEREDQRLADAKIRTSLAAKEYGDALRQIQAEMDRAGAGSLRYQQLQERQIKVFQQANREVAQHKQETSGLMQGYQGLQSALGQVGVAFGVLELAKTTVELAQQGAEAMRTRNSFNQLAQQAGTTGQTLMQSLRAASGGEISDVNLQLAANRAMLLGVADSAQEFGVLMEIARDRAQKMGISTTQAFNDLVTGLGRGSALILDNLGIMVSVGEVNESYAKSLGKTVTQLTQAEQKQALINAVIAQGRTTLAGATSDTESAAGAYAQLGTALDNAKIKLGELFAEASKETVSQLARSITALTHGQIGEVQALQAQTSAYKTAQVALSQYGQAKAQVQQTLIGYRNNIDGLLTKQQMLIAQLYQQQLAGTLTEEGFNTQTAAIRALSIEIETQSAALQGRIAAEQQATNSSHAAAIAAAEEAVALQQNAGAAVLAEAQSRLAAQAKDDLAQRAEAAGNAMFFAGDASDSARARIAAQYGVTLAQADAYYKLAQAANAVAMAQGGTSKYQDFKDRQSDRLSQSAPASASERARLQKILMDQRAAIRAQEAAVGVAAAQRDQAMATGSAAQKAAILRGELAKLKPGTEEYIRKQTELKQVEQQQGRASAKAGNAAARKAQTEANKAARKAQTEANKAARKAEAEANKAAREQAAYDKARLALLTDEERLIEYQKKLTTNLGETDRLELLKEIKDLEKKIGDERERQVQAAIDAKLLAIDDRKKRREESKELTKARRVLDSAGASAEMKQAARDVLERIPLEQQKRAEEIASKTRDAAGAAAPASTAPAAAGKPGAPAAPAAAAPPTTPTGLPVTTMPVGLPNLVAPPTPQAGTPQAIVNVDVNVYLDSEQIAAKYDARISNGLSGSKARGKGAS